MSDFPFILRPGTREDWPYVRDTWVMSQKESRASHDAGPAFCRLQKTLVSFLLGRAQLTVCCSETAPETILGWAVTERGVVHYVYVTLEMRRLGIAKALLRPYLDEDATFTHRPQVKGVPVPGRWSYTPGPYWAMRRLIDGEERPVMRVPV